MNSRAGEKFFKVWVWSWESPEVGKLENKVQRESESREVRKVRKTEDQRYGAKRVRKSETKDGKRSVKSTLSVKSTAKRLRVGKSEKSERRKTKDMVRRRKMPTTQRRPNESISNPNNINSTLFTVKSR